jgi:hypothetical protein
VWLYPDSKWSDGASKLSNAHNTIRDNIGDALDVLMTRYSASA